MGKPQEARTILATLEAPFLHREYFRSFARCGVLRNTGRALVAHIGSGYARRSLDVKAAKESSPASPAPASLASIFFLFFIVPALILLFAYSRTKIGDFRALCLRLIESIHPRLSCRLREVLFARRMIRPKIILRENMCFYI